MPKRIKTHLVVIMMTILGLVFIAAVIIFMTLPSFRRADQLRSDILEAQAELEAQYDNRRDLIQSSARVKQIKTTVDRLRSQFIEPGEELTFITRVEDIGEENGIGASISLGPASGARRDEGGGNEHFEVRFNGHTRDVLDAMGDLERLENLLLVQSVNIVAGEVAASATSTVSATIRGRIVFTPEEL